MIVNTVKQAAIARKVNTPAELARRMGVAEAVAGRLWNNEEHNATLKVINSVCEALNCDVKDVLRLTNGAKPKRKKKR